MVNHTIWANGLLGLIAILGTYMSFSDVRTRTVPLWTLVFFSLFSFLYALMTYGSLSDIMGILTLFMGISGFLWVYQKLRGQAMIGAADLIVLVAMASFVPMTEAPLFLSLTGLLGIGLVLFLKIKHIPFIPCMFVGLVLSNFYTQFFAK